jgi:hypothetical protein
MTLQLTDRQDQTLLVALEHLRITLAKRMTDNNTDKLNQYDILDRKHTLMHTITLMSNITKQPVATFMNPNPTQVPTETNQAG